MKNKVLLLVFISLISFSFKKDGCDLNQLYEEALTKLKKFHLLKDFKVSQKKKKDTPEMFYFPVNVNAGVKYRFFGIDNQELEGRLILTIYNNMKREFTVASTYNKISKKISEGIEFTSQHTGELCIGLSFLDGNKGCGVGMSSFLPD